MSKIYLGGLASNIEIKDIQNICSQYGEVQQVQDLKKPKKGENYFTFITLKKKRRI